MGRYDTVIFDMDGTVLDTLEDLTDSVNYALSRYGYATHSMEEIRGFVGNGIRLLIVRALPQGEDNPDFEGVFTAFAVHYREHCKDKTKPYDGIIELLSVFKARGVKTAIVSNKADFAVGELSKDMFGELIDIAIGEKESMGVRKKPAPDMVIEAMRLLGSDKSRTLYVGDSEVDIMTAENSGVDCISVDWGFKSREFLLDQGAKTIISKPEELLEAVLATELLNNLDKLHTTELGIGRIKRNLSLDTDNVLEWCRDKIKAPGTFIDRIGKNWYVYAENCIITVNAHSYTVITAHRRIK